MITLNFYFTKLNPKAAFCSFVEDKKSNRFFYHMSEITPCHKIDKPLVVYSLQIFGKRYAVHNNVAYIMTKFKCLYARNEISKQS